MSRAEADIATIRYATRIDAGGYRIVSDEPKTNGGKGAGPAPYDLLLASLAACTLITLRMYADRKQWNLTSAHLELHYRRHEKDESITRKLQLNGDLTGEQRARFLDIAERTPVTLTLKRGLPITTELVPPSDIEDRLDEALEESFPASDPPAVI